MGLDPTLSPDVDGGTGACGAGGRLEGGPSTAGIVLDTGTGVAGAAEGTGVAGGADGTCAETAGGAGVVEGTASSGILRVRRDRRRELPPGELESRVVAEPPGPSMSGIGGGPSVLASAGPGRGGGVGFADEGAALPGGALVVRGRGGADGAESGAPARGAPSARGARSEERVDEAGCVKPSAESSASSDGGASAEVERLGTSSTGGAAPPCSVEVRFRGAGRPGTGAAAPSLTTALPSFPSLFIAHRPGRRIARRARSRAGA
jgi:hypothetical protein